MLIEPNSLFGEVDTLFVLNGGTLIDSRPTPGKDIISIILPTITALLGFYFINRNVQKQLVAQNQIVKNSTELNRKLKLREILSELLVELNPTSGLNYDLLKNKKYLNTNHEKLVKRLVVIVNKSNLIESKLLERILIFGQDSTKIKEEYNEIEKIVTSFNI